MFHLKNGRKPRSGGSDGYPRVWDARRAVDEHGPRERKTTTERRHQQLRTHYSDAPSMNDARKYVKGRTAATPPTSIRPQLRKFSPR
ncbi:hypothetical protein Poly51_59880 [Rubripirellula tenax]|uniref:Uncharacterized protein n=1 Tax=Rubripirellula tenax TaxID=2528015 RepID=A0A5C6EC48_9BACT|nr:hypothetical protein Poly51_59880 [Rubripirellula tenax]